MRRLGFTQAAPWIVPVLCAVGDPAEALVGRTFIKKFAGVPYVGRVESYLPEYKWYAVRYTDGDDEELTAAALTRLLASSSEDDPAYESLIPGRQLPCH